MTRRTKKKASNVPVEQARQMLKVMTVLIRDEALLSFEEVVLQMSYCWRFTESVDESIKREPKP